MIETINYILPGATKESSKPYMQLAHFAGHVQAGMTFTVGDPKSGLQPVTSFRLDTSAPFAAVRFGGSEIVMMPNSFLPDRARPQNTLTLIEAARRLTGSIVRIDHTGIIVPDDVPADDWQGFTNFLASNALLIDYPAKVDGYDPENERWEFVIPRTLAERRTGHIESRDILRQPKFELVYLRGNEIPIVQIDMETRLTRDQTLAMFPGAESFDVPGLGHVFRSINVSLPYAGLRNARLDLRYAGDGALNEWNSAQMLLQAGQVVLPGGPATQLPAPQPT